MPFFASGKDAVLGGMIVMGIGFMIYGFIAHRFASADARSLWKQLQHSGGKLIAEGDHYETSTLAEALDGYRLWMATVALALFCTGIRTVGR